MPFFTPRYAKSKMGKKKKIGGGLRKKITIFQFWSFLSPKRLDGVYVLIDFRSFRVVLGIMAQSQLFFGVLEQFTLEDMQFYKKNDVIMISQFVFAFSDFWRACRQVPFILQKLLSHQK